jgi:predicted amidohydrolase YtcJ
MPCRIPYSGYCSAINGRESVRKLYTNFRWGFTDEPQEMLVENSRVLFRGASAGSVEAERVDLKGQRLLPSFIDSHCHILPTGLDLAKLHLGALSTREEILDAVCDRHKTMREGEWLHAVHYDQNRFADALHLSASEIDAVVGNRPAILRHSNGHASVASSAALAFAGVTEDTPDPKGGAFVRDSSGRLTGVLLETAHEKVTAAAPMPRLDQMVGAIIDAGRKMSELGICSATDMMTGVFDLTTELKAYRMALEQGCPIRIRLFLQWSTVLGARAVPQEVLDEFSQNVDPSKGKIAGLKIFADGAIGSATAAIYGRFNTTEGDQSDDGQLIYAPERLNEMVRKGHDAGYAIAIHSIGDRSTDLVMDAFEQLDDAKRHRIEHAMLLSDDQIERLARIGCIVTMQPEFLKCFGNSYRKQLPEEKFSKLERFRSVSEAGIPLALNSDRPITPGNPWDGIEVATKRPEGFDASENLQSSAAILGYTALAAKANGDEGLMGKLEAGELAEFQTFAFSASN